MEKEAKGKEAGKKGKKMMYQGQRPVARSAFVDIVHMV